LLSLLCLCSPSDHSLEVRSLFFFATDQGKSLSFCLMRRWPALLFQFLQIFWLSQRMGLSLSFPTLSFLPRLQSYDFGCMISSSVFRFTFCGLAVMYLFFPSFLLLESFALPSLREAETEPMFHRDQNLANFFFSLPRISFFFSPTSLHQCSGPSALLPLPFFVLAPYIQKIE